MSGECPKCGCKKNRKLKYCDKMMRWFNVRVLLFSASVGGLLVMCKNPDTNFWLYQCAVIPFCLLIGCFLGDLSILCKKHAERFDDYL